MKKNWGLRFWQFFPRKTVGSRETLRDVFLDLKLVIIASFFLVSVFSGRGVQKFFSPKLFFSSVIFSKSKKTNSDFFENSRRLIRIIYINRFSFCLIHSSLSPQLYMNTLCCRSENTPVQLFSYRVRTGMHRAPSLLINVAKWHGRYSIATLDLDYYNSSSLLRSHNLDGCSGRYAGRMALIWWK